MHQVRDGKSGCERAWSERRKFKRRRSSSTVDHSDAAARAKVVAARKRVEAAMQKEKKAHRRRFAAIAWRVKRLRPWTVARLGAPPEGWGCRPIRREPMPERYKPMEEAYGWPVVAEFWS